ncbi:MAG TPA: OmpA family protein [Bacteroidales bacterium]|nr:OmpA family protein [Bacteroidales bacterium]
MRTIRFTGLIILLTLISVSVQGQKNKALKAYAMFDAGAYADAIDQFKGVYDVIPKEQKADVLFHIGEAYRRIDDPKNAAVWFKKAIAKNYSNPIVYLRYGQVLKMNEKYSDARDMFLKYKLLKPDDKDVDALITSCDLVMEWINNPGPYQIENMKYFNSKSSDYSPAYASDDYRTVYFTSSRDEAMWNEKHGTTGQSYADIFVVRQDRKGKWSTPVPLGEPVNTEFEEGTPSLSSDYNTLYFTRCKTAQNKSYGCQIYSCRRNGDSWGKADPLTFSGDSMVIAHPAISPDELTLYFVSDMPGGVGGKDIWKVTRSSKNSEWGKPENLGEPVNTPGDEMFPYVHPDGTLYFSSDGHIGMGGLDIFKAVKKEDGSWSIENMKPPINSPADDFGIVFQKDEEKGFFSSSRAGKGDDNIYAFVLPPLKFTLYGTVKDEKTDLPLANVLIKSIGSDGVQIETRSAKDGTFRFTLKPNTDYVYLASLEGYLNGKERESTKGLTRSRDFRMVIYLSSIEKPIELPNIFYDFNKWDLRPESMVSLDELVETLNDNPNVTIELMSHTDSRGTDEFNMELSQKRAQSVVDYLIAKGIAPDRLSARGYGESQPKTVDKKLAAEYPFLKEGQVLTEAFINSLPSDEQKEICHQINRRTEFKVLRTDYVPR